MAASSGESWRRLWSAAADGLSVALLGFAALVQWTGGLHVRWAGFTISAHSGVRTVSVAALVLAIRHLIVPRPSILSRPKVGFLAMRRAWLRAETRARLCTVIAGVSGGVALVVDALGIRSRASGTLAVVSDLALVAAVAALLLARPRSTASADALSGDLFRWPTGTEWIWVTAAFVAATLGMLHVQAARLTGVPDYGDPLFSAWRLAWVAHQLPRHPWHLFDANIYYPAARTLAYSDATLLPATLAAPAIWMGAPVIVVYNALLLSTFAAAGVAMFVLGRAVTGSASAALVGAMAFAFDPFRFAHYSHLELQFTCWMPLAVLFLLRTLVRGRRRDGLGAALFVALEALSSLYYGAYLTVSLIALAIGWIGCRGWPPRRAWTSLAVGGMIVLLVAAAITAPYRENRSTVGERSDSEIRAYSATGRHYFTSSRQSALYGATLFARQGDELNLFTGTTPIVLAAIGVFPPVSALAGPALAGLAAGIDGSFGLNGALYSWLDRLPPFHAFRVPARFRAVVDVYLAVLVALGVARILRTVRSHRLRRWVPAALVALILVDLHPSITLRPTWRQPPNIYARIPDEAVVADLPLVEGSDAVFTFLSTFHWHPLVNGSSGFQPPWYSALATATGTFPDDRALDALARVGTQYIVIHEAYYRQRFVTVSAAADAQPRLQFVAATSWEEGGCRLYRLGR